MSEAQAPEQLLAEWTESEPQIPLFQPSIPSIVIGAALIFAALVGAGYWQKDSTFYFAAVADIVAGAVLIIQQKRPHPRLQIQLTNLRLSVGNAQYELANIAGFWLQEENSSTIINVEPAKAAMFPISFRYKEDNPEEARDLLLQVMDEVEARQQSFSDKVNRFIRF